MMKRLAILIGAALLGAAALVQPACGGSDALTLEEYFEELQQIDDDQQERSDELDEELQQILDEQRIPDDFTGDLDDDTREQLRDALRDQQDALEDFVDEVDSLNPPEEVEEPHDEAIEIFREALDGFGDAIDAAGDAETADEFFAGFEGLEEQFARANELCVELEGIAADNDIEVDLDCDEE